MWTVTTLIPSSDVNESDSQPRTKRSQTARDEPSGVSPPIRVMLDAGQKAKLSEVAIDLARRFPSVETDFFPVCAVRSAHELSRSLRSALVDFKYSSASRVMVIEGLDVDDHSIGPTPHGWSEFGKTTTLRLDIMFFLLASLIGDPIGWDGFQGGRMLHDIAPRKERTGVQVGNSDSELDLHTEEAFHPFRPDYFGLMCLRNEAAVSTTFVQIADLHLTDDEQSVLRREIFSLDPDAAYRPIDIRDQRAEAFGESSRTARSQEYFDEFVALVYGHPDEPYFRYDEAYMQSPRDREADEVLTRVRHRLRDKSQELVLRQGDVVFFDNRRTVHGRRSLRASYNGRDRWLKRLWLTDDLQKSRHVRVSHNSRIIC